MQLGWWELVRGMVVVWAESQVTGRKQRKKRKLNPPGWYLLGEIPGGKNRNNRGHGQTLTMMGTPPAHFPSQ